MEKEQNEYALCTKCQNSVHESDISSDSLCHECEKEQDKQDNVETYKDMPKMYEE